MNVPLVALFWDISIQIQYIAQLHWIYIIFGILWCRYILSHIMALMLITSALKSLSILSSALVFGSLRFSALMSSLLLSFLPIWLTAPISFEVYDFGAYVIKSVPWRTAAPMVNDLVCWFSILLKNCLF